MASLTPRRLFLGTTRQIPQPILTTRRAFQNSSRSLARKDAQGKDDLKPESNEYSKSGSDQAAAATDDAAFNPQKTRPETEHKSAGKESDDGNPLDASPANTDLGTPNKSAQTRTEGSPSETGNK